LAINREKKNQLIESYVEKLSRSRAIILTDYRGLTVIEMETLRAKLREAGGGYSIVKNTLVARALEEVGFSVPEDVLAGPTAIGFAYDEVPALAKAVNDFAKDTEILQIKGGVLDGKFLSPKQIGSLADLPPKEVVFAQLLGLIQQPGNRVAGVINAAGNKLAATIKAYADKLEGTAAA
jgi:large subunit ribosomal protein L10